VLNLKWIIRQSSYVRLCQKIATEGSLAPARPSLLRVESFAGLQAVEALIRLEGYHALQLPREHLLEGRFEAPVRSGGTPLGRGLRKNLHWGHLVGHRLGRHLVESGLALLRHGGVARVEVFLICVVRRLHVRLAVKGLLPDSVGGSKRDLAADLRLLVEGGLGQALKGRSALGVLREDQGVVVLDLALQQLYVDLHEIDALSELVEQGFVQMLKAMLAHQHLERLDQVCHGGLHRVELRADPTVEGNQLLFEVSPVLGN